MAGYDLTDFALSVIQVVLRTTVRVMVRGDDRRGLNRISRRLGTGAPRADIPARDGPQATRCMTPLRRAAPCPISG